MFLWTTSGLHPFLRNIFCEEVKIHTNIQLRAFEQIHLVLHLSKAGSSQLQGLLFNPDFGLLSVWSFTFSSCPCGFSPGSLTGYSKSSLGMNECADICVHSALQWTGVPSSVGMMGRAYIVPGIGSGSTMTLTAIKWLQNL